MERTEVVELQEQEQGALSVSRNRLTARSLTRRKRLNTGT